jgi:hypothetical protein
MSPRESEAALHGIDHVQVVVRDLEVARRTWARLGFTLAPRGRHLNRGTGNYCMMLREGYIELIGLVDPALPSSNLDAQLAIGAGPIALSFGAPSSAVAAKHLASAGFSPTGPTFMERTIERPEDMTGRVAFEIVDLEPEAVPGFRTFVCVHLSEKALRDPAWLEHANGAVATTGFTVAAEDPEPVLASFRRLYGDDAVKGNVVETGRERIEIVSPDALDAVYPGLKARPGRPLPCLVGISVRVEDLKRCKAALEATGVDPRPGPGGSWLVSADEATGTVLRFHS